MRGGRKMVEERITASMGGANGADTCTKGADARLGAAIGRPWRRQQEQAPLQVSGLAGTCW